MMRAIRASLIFMITCCVIQVQAQTATSVTSGVVTDPGTWDCSCVPTPAYDLIINGGDVVTANSGVEYNSLTITSGGRYVVSNTSFMRVNNTLDIQNGGVLTNDRLVVAEGDLIINGLWSGSRSLQMRGVGANLSGTGTITNTGTLYLRDGDKNILAGTDLMKSSGIIEVDNIRVYNSGAIATSVMTSSGNAHWHNQDDSRLEIVSILSGGLRIHASSNNNTVAFSRPGADQDIATPVGAVFFNLELTGTAGFKKFMLENLEIRGELALTDCFLDPLSGGVTHNIDIRGDWTARNGRFIPRTSTVTFNNGGPIVISNDVKELFYTLNFNGGEVTIEGDMDVRGTLTNSTQITMSPMDDYVLRVARNFNSIGSFIANTSTLEMYGSSAQALNGDFVYHNLTINNSGTGVRMQSGDHRITGTLDLQNGLLNTKGRLTMVSDANGDSRIAEITGGSLSGSMTAQRYIDAGATNWRFLTSPTQLNTLDDWTDDFATSGFTGSTWPTFSFTSIYFHDEAAPGTFNDGFVAATNSSDPILPGQGIWVWCGDNLNGTAPFTIDVEGRAYTGDISLPVTYTDHGSPADDGWNMVANPYISAIDWDSPDWVKTDIDDAIYIWVPELQQFASYVGGVSVNGGSRYIASSQAFWVHATSTSAELTAREPVKTAEPIGFKNSAPQDKELLRLALTRAGVSDELVLRIDPSATAGFDPAFDAMERNSATTGVPNFSSLNPAGDALMINSFPLVSMDTTIQLMFDVDQGGTHTIDFNEVSGSFANACLILEDTDQGTMTPVVEGGSLTVSLSAGVNQNRFKLLISGGIIPHVTNTKCPGASDGAVVAMPTGSGSFDYTWFDQSNTVVRTAMGINGPDTLQGVSAGSYTVSIGTSAICGSISASVEVLDPIVMQLNQDVLSSSCNGQADGSIDLNITGGVAPYSILWSDGSTGNSLNSLTPGNYSVVISDANGCSISENISVGTDMPVTASFSAPTEAKVDTVIQLVSNTTGATSGTWDMGDGTVYSVIDGPVHIYDRPGIYTITYTVENGSCSDVQSQDIQIGQLSTSIEDDFEAVQELVSFTQHNGELFVVINGADAQELTIMVCNVLGQQLADPIQRKFQTGLNQIDVPNVKNNVVVITALDLNNGRRWAKRLLTN